MPDFGYPIENDDDGLLDMARAAASKVGLGKKKSPTFVRQQKHEFRDGVPIPTTPQEDVAARMDAAIAAKRAKKSLEQAYPYPSVEASLLKLMKEYPDAGMSDEEWEDVIREYNMGQQEGPRAEGTVQGTPQQLEEEPMSTQRSSGGAKVTGVPADAVDSPLDYEESKKQHGPQDMEDIKNSLLKLMKADEEEDGEGTGYQWRHGTIGGGTPDPAKDTPPPYHPAHRDNLWLRGVRRQTDANPEPRLASYQHRFGRYPNLGDADQDPTYLQGHMDDEWPHQGEAMGGSTAQHRGVTSQDSRTKEQQDQQEVDPGISPEKQKRLEELFRTTTSPDQTDNLEELGQMFADEELGGHPPELWRTKPMGRTDLDPSMQEAVRGRKGPGSGVQNSIEKALLKLMKGEEIEKRNSPGQRKRPRQSERKFPSPSETRERAVKIGDPTKIKIPIPEETPSEDLEKINVGQAVRGFGRGLRNRKWKTEDALSREERKNTPRLHSDAAKQAEARHVSDHYRFNPDEAMGEEAAKKVRQAPMTIAERSASELNPELLEDMARAAGKGVKAAGEAAHDFFQPESAYSNPDRPGLMDAHARQSYWGRQASQDIARDPARAGKGPLELSRLQKNLLKLMKGEDAQKLNAMDNPPKENKESQALVADGDSKRPKSEVGTNDKMFKKEFNEEEEMKHIYQQRQINRKMAPDEHPNQSKDDAAQQRAWGDKIPMEEAIEQSLLKLMKEGEVTPSKVGMSRKNAMRSLDKAPMPMAPQTPQMPSASDISSQNMAQNQPDDPSKWSSYGYADQLAGMVSGWMDGKKKEDTGGADGESGYDSSQSNPTVTQQQQQQQQQPKQPQGLV